MFLYVLFCVGQLSHFLSCFGAGVTNLNEPFQDFAVSPLCGLGAGSFPFYSYSEQKAMRDEGVIYVAGLHY